jgi:VanZ family protein
MSKMRSFLKLLAFDPRYQKLKFRCALLLYLMVIVLGSIPGARTDIGEYASGLVLHASTYSVITFLLFGGTSGGAWSKACKAVFIIAMMGAFDEYVQSFFSYRTSSIHDWYVDISAAIITSFVLWLLWPRVSGGRPLPLSSELSD